MKHLLSRNLLLVSAMVLLCITINSCGCGCSDKKAATPVATDTTGIDSTEFSNPPVPTGAQPVI